MSDSLEARLEEMIMRHASETSASVRLAFLITLQRHILYLIEMIDQVKEEALALTNDLDDIIADIDRDALVNVDRIRARLVELTGRKEKP